MVKELRLAGISDIKAANAFLPTFMQDYNRRFAKSPQNPADAHRPVLHSSEELDLILSLHATRKLSKNLTFQFKNREYQLTGQGKGYRLRGAQVTVCEAFDDTVTVLYKGQTLSIVCSAWGSHAMRSPRCREKPAADRGNAKTLRQQAETQNGSNARRGDHP